MPTTLITNLEGNGVGVMGKTLCEHVRNVTKVIAVRCKPDGYPAIIHYPERCKTVIVDNPPHPSVLTDTDNEKFIYIESSCGLSTHLRHRRRVYIPMWEQGSTAEETRFPATIVAVSRHTQAHIEREYDEPSTYLPWPVEMSHEWRTVSRIRTVLHNAGSLGGNLRKGTDLAIRIFQASGVAKGSVRLVIHAFVEPPAALADLIGEAPAGITWVNHFEDDLDAIYHDADLLLLPSRIDGSPLIPTEAAARGIPALVTDSPPINEREEDPAFLLPVERHEPSPLAAPYAIVDVQAGAERLRRLCERDLSEKSRAVRAMAEKLSWEALGPAWGELCA